MIQVSHRRKENRKYIIDLEKTETRLNVNVIKVLEEAERNWYEVTYMKK